MKKKIINIFGGGCAGFSFIRRSQEVKEATFKFYLGSDNNEKDHYWGFWRSKYSNDFDEICLKWNKWKIINYDNEKTFFSCQHPYCIINKNKWINFCKRKIKNSNVKIIKKKVEDKNSKFYVDEKPIEGDYFFDSRNVAFGKNILLQHFLGLTIETNDNKFDPSTVILMDFRCNQSRGLHFMYVIPFSKNKALIESTLFSKNVENRKFYLSAINSYLKNFFNIEFFKVLKEEKGIIPMHHINFFQENSVSIGARGGATKPSSGYTFIYIQKQISNIIYQLNYNLKINNFIHTKFSLFMDKIFIKALEKNPKIFPDLFYKMNSRLSGDEMALFMNGNQSFKTWLKIIYSLPKLLFLYAIWHCIKRN